MIRNLLTNLDFILREKINLSRGLFQTYDPPNEPKKNLFNNNKEAEELEKKFYSKYNLEKLKAHSTCRNYLENLYFIELLEKYFTPLTFSKHVKILDIGSKNWYYAHALYKFFQHKYEDVELTGIEIDANRLYTDFYSRKDYANFYIKNLNKTRYLHQDFLKHNEKYDVITIFLPFVTPEPHIRWGLPLNKFKPEHFLAHSLNLLNEKGIIIIMNQGEKEAIIQTDLLKRTNANFKAAERFESTFLHYDNERYIYIIKK